MLYIIISSTRSSVIVSDPAPARALHESFVMLQKWQKEGVVKFVGLSGPFTPFRCIIMVEASDHEDAFARIAALPGTPYTDNALYPVVSVSSVEKYLRKFVESEA